MIVYLIGFMGCGKSGIGRKVAKSSGFGFVDTDREIEKMTGATVAELFASKGERCFREIEADVLGGVSGSEEDIVVAVGGGLPCFGSNMRLMNLSGMTVYLKSGADRLIGRLGKGRDRRPLIRGMSDEQLRTYISETMPLREPYYSQASVIVDCDGASDDYIVNHIVRCMHVFTGGSAGKGRDDKE